MNAMISDTMDVNLCRHRGIPGAQCRGGGLLQGALHRLPETPLCRVVLLDYGTKQNIVRELVARLCRAGTPPHRHGKRDSLPCAGRRPALQRSRRPRRQQRGNCRAGGACGQGTDLRHLPGASTSGAGARRKDRKVEIRASRGQPAGNRPCHRANLHDQSRTMVMPWLPTAFPASAPCGSATPMTARAKEWIIQPLRAFSVQFHPEAHAGPLDTAFLFDRFIGMMEET